MSSTLTERIESAVGDAHQAGVWAQAIAHGLKPLAIAVAGVAEELSSGFTQLDASLDQATVALGSLADIGQALSDLESELQQARVKS